MANPKRRHSKSRRDKRRTHDALPKPASSVCATCGEVKRPHCACPHCGHYRGRQVIEVEEIL